MKKGQKKMFNVPQKVLLISAHTDDCEVGMGGSIDRLMSLKCEIHWVVFSNAWQSLPSGFSKHTLLEEQSLAAEFFGVDQKNLKILDIPVRNFPQNRQKILDELIKLKKDIQPDLVFCPSLNDVHQDHATVANEAVRAFKDTTILGYIFPWNCLNVEKNLSVDLTEDNIVKKTSAVAIYKSQKHRPYTSSESIRSIAKSNGMFAGFDYCEVFQVINLVCKQD